MLNVNTFKHYIFAILIVVLAPVASFARGANNSESSNSVLQYLGATVMNPGAPYYQQGVFQEFLGASGESLAWPNFPRTWVQKELENYHETNVNAKLGLNIADVGLMAKYNIGYRYQIKTTFIAITTTDANMGGLGANNVTTGPASDTFVRSIRRFDPNTQKSYFVVDDKHPMVGFCIYELQLAMSKSAEGNINLMFGEINSSDGEVRRETQAIYSKFFQIKNNVPENDYLMVKCDQQFKGLVRDYAEYEFNKIIIEYVSTNHPDNQCNTDNDCTALYNKNHTLALGNPLSVPGRVARCLQRTSGARVCQIRSQEGRACPLYYGREGELTENFRYYKNATNQANEAKCDSGLKCTMDSHADGFMGFLFPNMGSATCKKR